MVNWSLFRFPPVNQCTSVPVNLGLMSQIGRVNRIYLHQDALFLSLPAALGHALAALALALLETYENRYLIHPGALPNLIDQIPPV